jgi:metal-responsive CopG/Arc/MetJ family transcriptional regulator
MVKDCPAMTRTTATFSVSLPPEMMEELEQVRKAERRTRSELIREALRRYFRMDHLWALGGPVDFQ